MPPASSLLASRFDLRAPVRRGALGTLLLCLAVGLGLPASAPARTVDAAAMALASLDFGAHAQDGIRAHQQQLRSRQKRVRDTHQPSVASFSNGLTMSDQRRTVPLQMRPSPLPGRARLLAPSSLDRFNTYLRGNLHSDGGSGSGLVTDDLTLGTDYRFSRHTMAGLAAGRQQSASAAGTAVSAYLTINPVDRFYIDMSVSWGRHQTRADGAFGTLPAMQGLGSSTRAFSLSLNHPRQIGNYTWQPYSRLDRSVTDVQATASDWPGPTVTRDSASLSFGSSLETVWATPFGTLRPLLLVEVQRELIAGDGNRPASAQTSSRIGVGLSTRVNRDVSAYAQSRYSQDGDDGLDRLVMLGLRFAF